MGNSWPLCNGQLVRLTDVTPEKLIEFMHRMTTGISSIFVIVLAICAWIYMKNRRETKPLAIIAVLFLIIQALMGMAAVVWGQNPYIMAAALWDFDHLLCFDCIACLDDF